MEVRSLLNQIIAFRFINYFYSRAFITIALKNLRLSNEQALKSILQKFHNISPMIVIACILLLSLTQSRIPEVTNLYLGKIFLTKTI